MCTAAEFKMAETECSGSTSVSETKSEARAQPNTKEGVTGRKELDILKNLPSFNISNFSKYSYRVGTTNQVRFFLFLFRIHWRILICFVISLLPICRLVFQAAMSGRMAVSLKVISSHKVFCGYVNI